MIDRPRRVATYERVSSEDQRERETIQTQTEELARQLELSPEVELVDRYVDDGVSGAIPMAERPGGKRLMEDARGGRFAEVWVWRLDRLGRDDVDPLIVYRDLERLRVKVVSVTENINSPLEFHIRVAMAAEERRAFLARSAAGMNRAARAGRYCGGIVPIGYKVEGVKQDARLVPSDILMWRDWTEADVVKHMYQRLVDGWSCVRVADELNQLAVPTVYQKDARKVRRGERTRATDCLWRPGRILNIVRNPVYKGEYHYGRRSKKRDREIIVAKVPALVSEEIWQAAQETLGRNRLIAKNTGRVYLLRSLMKCGLCRLNYTAAAYKNEVFYRCNGQITYRDRSRGMERCPSKWVRGSFLEPRLWADVERFLRNPGELVDELIAERNETSAAAALEAERQMAEAALAELPGQRDRVLDAYKRGHMGADRLDAEMASISEEEERWKHRLAELVPDETDEDAADTDLLAEIRRRVDEGFDDATRHEIMRLLVKQITVHTEHVDGAKRGRVVVEYRFPDVVDTSTGRGSGRRRA